MIDPTKSANGERLRYRRNWRGKLILQVEEMVPYNFDPQHDIKPGGYVGHWRDARLSDLPSLGLGVAP